MFGYVVPYKDELKLKEYKQYKQYYCAVCNQIRKKYGRFATLFLSYEIVFTLILMDDFCEENKTECMQLGCQFDIVHIGEIMLSKDLLNYLSWINIYLSLWKLKDNWLDDRNIGSYLIYRLYLGNKKYKYDCETYRDAYAYLNHKLEIFYSIEEERECTFDELAQLMGDVWQGIVEYGAKYTVMDTNTKELLKGVCDDLAKYLYCIDAYDDYENDMKKKRVNLLQKIQFQLDDGMDNGKFIVCLIIHSIKQKIAVLEFHKNNSLIRNVILFGLDEKLKLIVKRKEKENAKRKCK